VLKMNLGGLFVNPLLQMFAAWRRWIEWRRQRRLRRARLSLCLQRVSARVCLSQAFERWRDHTAHRAVKTLCTFLFSIYILLLLIPASVHLLVCSSLYVTVRSSLVVSLMLWLPGNARARALWTDQTQRRWLLALRNYAADRLTRRVRKFFFSRGRVSLGGTHLS
jgi:hypothetical protein